MTLADSSLQSRVIHVDPHLVPRETLKRESAMNGKVTYRQQVSFCGKPNCRKCREGTGHGPYWYAYRVVDGHTVRTYIGKNLPPGVEATEESTIKELAPLELADRHISLANLSSAIDILDRLLATDPTNEAAVQRLMIALARSKRRGEALRSYQRLASVLQKSYNRSPSAETQALYEAVQRGDETLALPATATALLQQSSSLSQVETPSAKNRQESAFQRFPPEVQIGRSNQSPLVGRDTELAALRQLLLSTLEATHVPPKIQKHVPSAAATTLEIEHPQCVVLMGEAGIGKTRLAEEMAREAVRHGWAVVWSHVYAQESGIPYRLWTEALRRIIDQSLWQGVEAGSPRRDYSPLKALLPELQEFLIQNGDHGEGREEIEMRSARFAQDPYEQEQLRLREAVYSLFTSISASTPLLIVLDDVQWADGSSCELFGYLARRLQGHSIVLLGTCRESELSSTHPLRPLLSHLQRERAVETLHVQPLTDAQIGRLVADLPAATVQHIQVHAAGNPFFAEELAHFFSTRPPRIIGAGRGQQPETPGDTALPGTIAAALDSRLHRLSNACQQLLSKAAVLGGSFGFPLIAAIEANDAGVDEDALLDLLEEALRSGLLTEEGTGTRITYSFWHPLLASHLYNRLSATRRARLHRRTAEVLQQVFAAREDEVAATITQHLVKGGAEAVQIARYAEMAANYAYALSAYPEAERHYRLAVEHIERAQPGIESSLQGEERLHFAFLLERQAECTRIQGNFSEARQLFERVLRVRGYSRTFASPGEAEQEGQISALLWSEIGWTWRFTGDNTRARQCCKRGEQVLRDAGILKGPAWARLRFLQGSIYWQEGNYEKARRAIEEAMRLFEKSPLQLNNSSDPAHLTRTRRTLLGDPVDLGRTYALLGAVTNAVGRRTEALGYMNRALALYEQHDRQREIAHVCCNIGYVHLKRAEYSLAQDFLRRSLNLAERIGDTPLMSVVFHNLGELAAYSGKQVEAEAWCRRSLGLAEQVNDREYVSLWNADLATILQEQGKLAEAEDCVHRALTIGRAMHNAPCVGLALVALGNLRIAQAQAQADQSAAGTINRPLRLTGEVGEEVGAINRPLRLTGEEQQFAAKHFLLRARGSLQRGLALQGLETETSARARLALARVSMLLGEREEALRQAQQAREDAGHYELIALLAQCDQLLQDIDHS